MTDAIVLGAGIAGLTAARALTRAGRSALGLEARDRLGGRMFSVRDFTDHPIEGGAEFIHGVGAEHWEDVRAANLTVRPSPITKRTMFDIGHGAHWLPIVLMHPGVWPVFTIMRHIANTTDPTVSARQFIEARGYRGRARRMAEMVLTAHLPGSLDDVGVRGLVEDRVLDLENGLNHRVLEGYDALPTFIGTDVDVRYGFEIAAIEWSQDEVVVTSSEGEALRAPAAITTLPVGVLHANAIRFTPELPESKRDALSFIEMGPVVRILLAFDRPFWPRRMATVCSAVGAVTLYWAVFQGMRAAPPVLNAYATGPRAAALSSMSDVEAIDVVLEDLRRLFPRSRPKEHLKSARRIDWAADPYARGGYTFLKPGAIDARKKLAAPDTGALFWAGSATAIGTIAASVQGAYTSGKRAAAEALAGPLA